jgi:hypothetical protein
LIDPAPARSYGDLLARAYVLLAVLVLVCVPGLTRMSQRLETASHAPSFAKNIDCPPKKVTVVPTTGVATPVALTFDLVSVVRPAFAPDTTVPVPPDLFGPRPLRAPPLALLA